MHNGTTTIDAYGQNLDKLKVGDRVGVVRRDSGVIHFYVNGEDQGPAATNVPERIYGVIDLYGQAAQVIEISPENLDIYILLISRRLLSTCLTFEVLMAWKVTRPPPLSSHTPRPGAPTSGFIIFTAEMRGQCQRRISEEVYISCLEGYPTLA